LTFSEIYKNSDGPLVPRVVTVGTVAVTTLGKYIYLVLFTIKPPATKSKFETQPSGIQHLPGFYLPNPTQSQLLQESLQTPQGLIIPCTTIGIKMQSLNKFNTIGVKIENDLSLLKSFPFSTNGPNYSPQLLPLNHSA
jgi:hypothetical protein